jgi:hypothetical protein
MEFDDRLGCAACTRNSPEQTWTARASLAPVDTLVDESHYHVMLLECPACGDRCVSIFTETIDWAHGDDPQHWELMPLTWDEAEYLIGQQPDQVGSILETIGKTRRHLERDHPSSGAARLSWRAGNLFIGPHD